MIIDCVVTANDWGGGGMGMLREGARRFIYV